MHRAIAAMFALGLVGCGSTPTDTGSGNGTPGFTVGAPMPIASMGGAAAPPPAAPPPAAAGSAAPPPGGMNQPVTPTPTTPVPTTPDPTTPDPTVPGQPPKLAMDECNIDTGYDGDEFCILEPDPSKGFQMHIGPSNYENPEPEYVLAAGREVTETFRETSGNTEDVYYYWRQYRMRPGSHHLIINNGQRRLGGSSNGAKDNPEAGVIAKENEGVGMPLAANSQLSNSLHYFNFTDAPIIKEVWVNFWYRDASVVTEPTREVFSMLGMNIAPGTHVLKHGACNITSPGRLLTVYGHVHSHNQRFSVWRTRGTEKLLIHEAYDWEHPGISEYSSTVMNPVINAAARVDGGVSGVMDLMPGDRIEFECDIINDTTSVFLGLNEANDDEMCIMIGDTVGTSIPPLCTSSDLPAN